MACVAMVKRDERNSKFCNSVEGGGFSDGCWRRILIRELRSLDSAVSSDQIIHQIWKISSADYEGIPQT